MSNKVVLLIRGFAVSRDEVKPLKKFLKDKEYTVEMPLLKGHEATKKELADSTYQE